MSSQYAAANQSGESGVSSLQRSGLNISVGDTKSIVLALQALQQKIRALEQDRDYHQDQYERALHAHEAYKLDVERQMEEERLAHRKREHELTDLLRKALEEKKRLESNYGNQHDDLANFRKELESMIEAEKQNARHREGELEGEIETLRAVVRDERARYTGLTQALERLKRERQEVDEINEQLRLAMDELLTQEEDKRRRLPAGASATSAGPRMSRVTRQTGAPRSQQRGQPRTASGRGRARQETATTAPRTYSAGRRHTYEHPTVNSILRDVRNASIEIPCNHDLPVGEKGAEGGAANYAPYSQHTSVLAPASPSGRPSSAQPRGRPTPNRSMLSEVPEVTGVRSPERHTPASSAIPEVEAQLKVELEDLQTQYRDTVARASSEDIPREVLSTALTKISALIDHKLEQLRLIRGAQKELEAVAVGASNPHSPQHYFDPACKPLSAEELGKATQRSMLMNELRSLLADSAAR